MKQAEKSSESKKRERRIRALSSYLLEQKVVDERPLSERCAHCHLLLACSTLNYLRGAMIKHVKKCKKARGINPEDERGAEEFEAMQDGDVMEGSEREKMDGIFEGGEGEAIGEEENWVDLDGEEEFVGEDAILMTGHQKEVGDEDSDDASKYGSGDESEKVIFILLFKFGILCVVLNHPENCHTHETKYILYIFMCYSGNK